jgi:CRISPR-associated endoribonuclease Cas6
VAYLKRDISFKDSFEVISKYISFSMAQNDEFLKLHNQNRYKFYNFGSFYPPQKEQVYKKSNSYTLQLRSPDESFINFMANSLRENINNPDFLIVEVEKKVIKQFFISKIYSITPTIVTTENGRFWTEKDSGDVRVLQRQLHSNLEKKYNTFYNQNINATENFIELLSLNNLKPQNIWTSKNGKSFRFFGNKFTIVPREDEVSQKLAFMALSCGLGEKNSYGGGFCLWER